MVDDPLGAVYAFVERAYVRLQAADVLTQCIDEGKLTPMQTLAENLVLAGPQSLSAFREVLEELNTRRKQLEEDRQQVSQKLVEDLKAYGVQISGMHTPLMLTRLTPSAFLAMLRAQDITQESHLMDCLQYLQDAHGLLSTLDEHTHLLDEIDRYLQDWLWGMIYLTTRQAEAGENPPDKKYTL
jgi:hypothetical protein